MKLLLKKYINGVCSASEKEELEDALKSRIVPKELLRALKDLWDDPSLTQSSNNTTDRDKILDRIHHTINVKESIEKNKRKSLKMNSWKYVAAAVVFMIMSVGAWYSGSIALFKKEHYYMVSAPKRQSSQISLPDGTKVWLNTGSTLSYSSKYGKITRRVELVGEGFFDVQKDKNHPFKVIAKGVEVTALGTRFNVGAYKGDKEVIVTLEEGRIKTVFETEERILEPSMQVVITKGNMKVKEVDTDIYTSWHMGKIIFKDESLLNIAHQLEKIYDVKIIFKSESIKEYRYRGAINTENSIIKTLDKLHLSTNINFKIENNQIILSQE